MQDKDELIIETQHLSFSFSKGKAVLEDLNLQIPKGAIYGFLGPNGAGKTTTIRLLLDLLKPVSGQVKVFGEPIASNPIAAFARIGALIEMPSLYEHLTGFDNVSITAGICNIQKSRVWEVLDIVQLRSNAYMHVRNYSLGMKQRLGLALALLSSPDLLILDEPTNGLDPNGIIEIRELLLHLSRDHGVTILVSSHLLSEIEKLVSHIGILDKGKILFQGPVTQLQEIKQGKSVIEIDTDQNSLAMKLLADHQQAAKQGAGYIEVRYRDKHQLAEVIELLAKAGLAVYRIQLIESSLEETFLSFINN